MHADVARPDNAERATLEVEALQAGGTGRRLLAAAETYIRERGGAVVRMTVITVRTPLLAWYGRRGYADTGARKPYAHPGARTREPLEFAVLEKRL